MLDSENDDQYNLKWIKKFEKHVYETNIKKKSTKTYSAPNYNNNALKIRTENSVTFIFYIY